MKIINNQRFITNSQLEEIINLLGEEYSPLRIVVFESPIDILKYRIKNCIHITECDIPEISELQNYQVAKYMVLTDTIKIFLNYNKDIMNKEEKQVNLIFDLVVELKRRTYLLEKIKEKINEGDDKEIKMKNITNNYGLLFREPLVNSIYKFASDFMNKNAEWLSVVMNWKDQWTF